MNQNKECRTVTFDKFEKKYEDKKLTAFQKDLVKLLRMQNLRNEYLEKQLKNQKDIVKSIDDEFHHMSEEHEVMKGLIEANLQPNYTNVVESAPDYQRQQGLFLLADNPPPIPSEQEIRDPKYNGLFPEEITFLKSFTEEDVENFSGLFAFFKYFIPRMTEENLIALLYTLLNRR